MRKKLFRAAVILIFITALLALLLLQLKPYIADAAKNCVQNAASDEILSAVNAEILESSEDFSKFVILEKDVQGNITAIRSNMALMNGLKNRIVERIGRNLGALEEKTLSVALGSMFLPSFFGMSGPHLKTKITSLSTVESEIYTTIDEVGINQALQTVSIHVQIDLTVLSPVGTQNVTVCSDIPLAETVILGTVPNTYLSKIKQ